MSVSESEHTVSAGILQRPGRLVEVDVLSPAHFNDPSARRLFSLARTYFKEKKGKNALDLPLARSILEGASSKKAQALLPVVQEYGSLAPISDAEFRDAISRLISAHRRALTKERATQAVEASLEGDDEGARNAMRRGLLEAEDADDESPVDIRSLEEIEAEKADLNRPITKGECFDIGFAFLTSRTAFRRGELTIIGGYTGDGKSHISKSFTYNACMRSGARMLFASLEMDRREMRVLFVCHHASTIDPRGVPWSRILNRTASKAELRLYARALLDFRISDGAGDEGDEVRSKSGGTVFLWAPRRRPSMLQFGERVKAMAQQNGLTGAVGDYLELFRPAEKTRDYRHDLTESVYCAKETAREANVWMVMNHQISRSGRDAAEKRSPRHYLLRDLGESSGVERGANQVVWVFSDEALKADRQARVGLSKAREGETCIEGEEVMADFSRGFMAEIA